MRIALLCNDTRGVVQSYVVLGIGLRLAGHEVRAVAPGQFKPLFEEAGIAETGTMAAMRLMAREMPKLSSAAALGSARMHDSLAKSLSLTNNPRPPPP